MIYKKKLIILLSVISVLALLYAGSFIFSAERSYRRSAYYTWLDQGSVSKIDRIAIKTREKQIEFLLKNQKWVVLYDGIEYPARELRIEDFIGIFTERGAWHVRSNSASAHAGFGLESATADRVIIYGGSLTLLDVLIGYDSAYGNEVSIRKYANDEVRSGENRVKTYVTSPVQSWFDLKLFPETENVQKITIVKDDGEEQAFSLSSNTWTINNNADSNSSNIESYIRILLSIEGDNFEGILRGREDFSISASITAEFGSGKIITICLSEPDESNRRLAYVKGEPGSELIYSIPAWQNARLFRETSGFEAR